MVRAEIGWPLPTLRASTRAAEISRPSVNYLTVGGVAGMPTIFARHSCGGKGMGNKAQVADYVGTTAYELCKLCREAALADLAHLLEMAALEASNIATPRLVQQAAE